MRDGIDGIGAIFFSYPVKASFDIQPRVEGSPVIFCDHELADPVYTDKYSVSSSSEVIHGIDFDGWESKDLLVY
jgi:hypothetical protein